MCSTSQTLTQKPITTIVFKVSTNKSHPKYSTELARGTSWQYPLQTVLFTSIMIIVSPVYKN